MLDLIRSFFRRQSIVHYDWTRTITFTPFEDASGSGRSVVVVVLVPVMEAHLPGERRTG